MKINLSGTKYTYTGEARKPAIKVYDGKKKLKINKDYKLSYKHYVRIGEATVTIKGIGNYTGTVNRNYYIVPQKQKITKVSLNANFTKAKIEWKKDQRVTGYIIYMSESKNGKYKRIKTIKNKNTTSYVKKGLNKNKEYYFKILGYKNINSKKVCYSKVYSDPKTNMGLLAEIKLTSTSRSSNRNYNLGRASKKLNGTIIKPGQIFDWYRIVGQATKANGYKLAAILVNGKSEQGYGGGVCQVSTTLYQAAIKAKLKIVERHTHSAGITYTKLGKDATVSYPTRNLRIKNNKKYSIVLVTSANKNSTTCKIYKVGD